MNKKRSSFVNLVFLFCLVGLVPSALCQEAKVKFATLHGTDGPSKIDNGFLIAWRNTEIPGNSPKLSRREPEGKVQIFDGAVSQLAVCDVVNAIKAFDPTSSGVSIYDVSARKPGFIAVAAVYSRAGGNPVGVLMYFDWNGSLLLRTVLGLRQQIQALEIDRSGQVWALNDFDPDNPARFVFLAFDRNGSVVKQAVKLRKWSTDESIQFGGQTSFGIVDEKVWAWLPKSKTFISFDPASGKREVKHTGFPPMDASSQLYARRAALLPNGHLLMDIGSVPPGRFAGWFTWSDRSGWQQVNNHAADGYAILYTVQEDEAIFASFENSPLKGLVFQSERISQLTPIMSLPH